nr:eukaryotic translation initiation factor 2D-like [Lytechinus pictus]
MFKKPFHVKSNAAMKGSDKRKMKSSVLLQFSEITSDQVDSIFPNKAQTTSMKIQTHTGEHMVVYCVDGVPAFFENEKVLYPTVYTLWKCPSLLPCLTTFPAVIEKLIGGADLMLPGVVMSETGLPLLEKSQLCSVKVVGNLAPIAIGTASMSSSDMLGCAMKGKGVFTLHCFGDHLWATGGKLKPPQIDPFPQDSPSHSDSATNVENSAGSDNKTNRTDGQRVADGDVCQGDEEGGVREGGIEEEVAGLSLGGGAVGGEEVVEEDAAEEVSPIDAMDELLRQCLLHSLKKKVKPSDLPLLTSSLYRNHMQTCCPEGKSLDLKKSSYKKLSKFLQAMQEKGLLDVRELRVGVDSVTAIHKNHDEIRSFVPLPDESDSGEQSGAASIQSSSSKAPEGPPEIRQFYAVLPNQVPVLQHSGYKRGCWMTKEDVRNAITAYIKNESLVDQNDYSRVTLDPILHDAVVNKSECSITHLKWDQLFTRFLHKMNPGYQIVFPGELPAGVQPQIHKGQVQPIILKLDRKAGNKWITVIQNLEQFSLDPKEFAHRLQIAVAASTTVTECSNAKLGLQVTVQGNQIKFLDKFLTGHYQIPRRYIDGLQQTAKAKGKGKR